MNKTILLFGGSGMVGRELVRALSHHMVVTPPHTLVDITDAIAVEQSIAEVKPDFVINAAAIVNMDTIEKNEKFSSRTNVQGALVVACAVAHHSIPQLILSSSYVFGESPHSYSEDSDRNPANKYGKTKVDAEDAVIICGSSAPYYIVRTSWIYSRYRETFVDEVARTLLRGETFEASDQRGNPTCGRDFAAAVVRHIIDPLPQSGTYHIVNDGDASRYEIACEIAHTLHVPESLVVAKEFSSRAMRPSVVLVNTKLAALHQWKDALHEYLVARYMDSYIS